MRLLVSTVQCEQLQQYLTINAFRHVIETKTFVLLFLGNCLVLFNYALIMVWSSCSTVWANGVLYVIFSFISLRKRTRGVIASLKPDSHLLTEV